MPYTTLLALAKSVSPRAYEQAKAQDAAAPQAAANMVLLDLGYVTADAPDPTAVPASARASVAYHIAYILTASALDLVRTKVAEASAGPTSAKFRNEVEYLQALLKRLAARAGIDDTGQAAPTTGFMIARVGWTETLPIDEEAEVEF